MIQLSLEQGCTLRVIARSVQRAPSSTCCRRITSRSMAR
ncbi:hypothetical protein [Propionivibrio sp.]